MTRKLFGIILCAFLLICAAAGLADQAEDLTGQCSFSASSSKGKYSRMTDGDSATWWATKDGKHNWLQITAPEGKTIGAVSLHFRNRPDSYEVQVQQGKDWETELRQIAKERKLMKDLGIDDADPKDENENEEENDGNER